MASEIESVDIGNAPELPRLVDDVRRSGRATALRRGDETVAILSPVGPPEDSIRASRRRRRRTDDDDPLWNIIGLGRSAEPGDVAANKHKYLDDALYRESHPSADSP